MSDSTEAQTYSMDACDEAFVRDFCPYKGSPDPFIVWRAAWRSACAALAQQAATPPSAAEDMLHTAICEAVGISNIAVELVRTEAGRKMRDILRKALVDYADARQAATPAPAEPVAVALDRIMEQAQVFASSWSLVGGRFDSGDGLQHAEAMKAELREMIEAALAAPPATPAAQPAETVPAGWRVVPEEPTEAMLDAANENLRAEYRTLGLGDGSDLDATKAATNYYRAMLAAAPAAPSTAQEAG